MELANFHIVDFDATFLAHLQIVIRQVGVPRLSPQPK